MRFGVLGPVTAWTDAGTPVVIQGLKMRAETASGAGQPSITTRRAEKPHPISRGSILNFRIFRSTVLIMVTYTMTQATKRTAEIVNEARYTNQPVLITDHGKPAAALISPSLLAHYQALEDAADLAVIEEIKAAGGPNWVSNDDAQHLMDEIEAEHDGPDTGR
jgi:prevent-host-death family protein